MSTQVKHRAVQLYDYHVWANNKYFDHLRTLPQEVCDTEITSVFSTVNQVLVHIAKADMVLLRRMRGDSHDVITAQIGEFIHRLEGQNLAAIEAEYGRTNAMYEDFLTNHSDLDQIITYEHPRLGRIDVPLVEVMQQVCNHGTYHRGNLSAMLHQLGHQGAPTDYLLYLYAMNQ
ncbi:DinB family protein [Paenibacillus albiflavus]|nr:DinB family protein [Paenibacillus albiflavus]